MVSYRKPYLQNPIERYREIIGCHHDSRSLRTSLLRYIAWRQERNYAEKGIITMAANIFEFVQWCEVRGLAFPQEITRPILERYQSSLHHQKNRNRGKREKPLTVRTQKFRLMAIQGWFKWLTRQNLILANPAADLELPRTGKHLPRYIMQVQEIEQILALPDLTTPAGVRDRTIMEILWSTGLRRAEIAGLDIYDIDVQRQVVNVRQGKGRRDRVVPIGERALSWAVHYQEQIRPLVMVKPDLAALFLSGDGLAGLRAESIGGIVNKYVRKSGLLSYGSCHLFRHAMATHMLENGADTRWIQAILGHTSLESTQVYTQVSIRALQAVHEATHPASSGQGTESEGQGKPAGNKGPGSEAEALPEGNVRWKYGARP